jgi:DNA-binding transcriptional ArsR family regulator
MHINACFDISHCAYDFAFPACRGRGRVVSWAMIQRVDEMFAAIGDQTRLRVLHLLIHKELCVAGLVEALEAPQPKISQHLRVLRAAGLVQERRVGKWRFYSLVKPSSRFHKLILRCLGVCHWEVKVLRRDCARMRVMLASGGDRSGYRRIPTAPPPLRGRSR